MYFKIVVVGSTRDLPWLPVDRTGCGLCTAYFRSGWQDEHVEMCRHAHVSLERVAIPICCIMIPPPPSQTISCVFSSRSEIGAPGSSAEWVLFWRGLSLGRAGKEGIEAKTFSICSHPQHLPWLFSYINMWDLYMGLPSPSKFFLCWFITVSVHPANSSFSLFFFQRHGAWK